jgi:hypothetical protein
VPNYSMCSYEQLAGPWQQLAGMSVNDALVYIKQILTGGDPPLRTARQTPDTLAGDLLSSRLRERGQRQEPDSPAT